MTIACDLPGGLVVDGLRHRAAELRAPTGQDELALVDAAARPAAERVTSVLGRLLVRVGAAPGDAAVARALRAGDRDALMLTLRRLVLGDAMSCVMTCPACESAMEAELDPGAMVLGPVADLGPRRVGRRLVRAVTGADLEAVASVAVTDPDAAVRALLERCCSGAPLGRARRSVSAALAALDPQADLRLDVSCPSCGERSSVPFDAGGFVLAELEVRARSLLRDVHALARWHGWSERDILALPSARRAAYLDLLAGEREAALA